MKELVWCTDIHLDRAHPEAKAFFVRRVQERNGPLLVGGDISEGDRIVDDLKYLSETFKDRQIYFVLGNHDYYTSSFHEVRYHVAECVSEHDNLHWLDQSGPIKLTDNTALIGSGLWCDWKAGNQAKSCVWIPDYHYIEELKFEGAPMNMFAVGKTWDAVEKLAKIHTDQLMRDFHDAVEQGFKKIVILTHVPPFHEGAFYGGKVQDDDWAPHFVCWQAGHKLKEALPKDVDITVLCGHTHGAGEADILPNLHVKNGGAKYKKPAPQDPIFVD